MNFVGRIARQGGLLATLTVALVGAAQFVYATDWSQWRQNVLHTGSHDEAVQLPLSLGWTVEGYHVFSPAVANGALYLPRSTDASTPTPGGGLAAYRLDNGELLWERTDLAVWGNAAVSGETVVVGGSALYALNTLDGSTRWAYDEAAAADIIFEHPAIYNGVVYAWKRNTGVIALNLNTGERLWTTAVGSAAGTPPLISTDSVYAIGNFSTAARGTIWKLNPLTGAIIWSRSLLYFVNGGTLVRETVVASGPVRTFGVDTVNGTVRWFRNLSSAGMPVVRGDTISILYDRQLAIVDFRAYLVSFNALTGPGGDNGIELGGEHAVCSRLGQAINLYIRLRMERFTPGPAEARKRLGD